MHTSQYQEDSVTEVLLPVPVGAKEVYVAGYGFTLCWFLRGRIHAPNACPPPRGIKDSQSVPAPSPLETKNSLRVLLSTVPQRATTSPFSELRLENCLLLPGL